MLGLAVGCIGMSFDDFCLCSFGEFESIYKAWREYTDGTMHDAWERMRISAAIAVQPHTHKKIIPRQLIPLPWDNKKTVAREHVPELTAEQRRKRSEEVARPLGDLIND